MSEQHYRMTLEDAIAHHKADLIPCSALLYYYVRIRCAPGWKIKLSQKEVCAELGISKASFYRAIGKLQETGLVNFEAPGGFIVSLNSETTVSQVRQESQPCDSSLIPETPSLIPETPSLIPETTNPTKPALCKDSSDSPDLYSNSFQLFINSLSDCERESFLKFSEEKAKALPKPPQLIEAWIAKHYQDLHKQFLASAAGREAKKEAIAAQFDWKNDPRFDTWIWEAFNRGYEWVHEDEAEREQRNAFYDWALKVNAYLGICYEEYKE